MINLCSNSHTGTVVSTRNERPMNNIKSPNSRGFPGDSFNRDLAIHSNRDGTQKITAGL